MVGVGRGRGLVVWFVVVLGGGERLAFGQGVCRVLLLGGLVFVESVLQHVPNFPPPVRSLLHDLRGLLQKPKRNSAEGWWPVFGSEEAEVGLGVGLGVGLRVRLGWGCFGDRGDSRFGG